ncbi:hypothetical protein CEUSTIGMA_g6513.t1, partial [Chlamydomonas eustigma]
MEGTKQQRAEDGRILDVHLAEQQKAELEKVLAVQLAEQQ